MILMRKMGDQEIVSSIMTMEPNKAPGQDGFTIHFYRDC